MNTIEKQADLASGLGRQRILVLALISAFCAIWAMAQTPAESGTATNATAPNVARRGGLGGFGGGGFGRGGFGRGGGGGVPAGVEVQRNVPYVANGSGNQVLDLFLPTNSPNTPLPLMIWIHGGAWMGGDQSTPPVLFLLTNGYAVASIQHRFSSQAKWPAQAYDCKAAVRFLRANAAKYNFDPNRFGIGGDSSGGHLAAFVGTSGDAPEMEGDLGNPGVSSRVRAVVDWFGPTDLEQMGVEAGPNSMIQHNTASAPEAGLLGGPVPEHLELAKTANPITYINKNCPPFLIMHGDNDQLVPHEQSVILAKALMDAGDEVTLKTLHGAGHEDPQFQNAVNKQLVLEFLDLHLKSGN